MYFIGCLPSTYPWLCKLAFFFLLLLQILNLKTVLQHRFYDRLFHGYRHSNEISQILLKIKILHKCKILIRHLESRNSTYFTSQKTTAFKKNVTAFRLKHRRVFQKGRHLCQTTIGRVKTGWKSTIKKAATYFISPRPIRRINPISN